MKQEIVSHHQESHIDADISENSSDSSHEPDSHDPRALVSFQPLFQQQSTKPFTTTKPDITVVYKTLSS